MSTPLNTHQWAQASNVGKVKTVDVEQVAYSQHDMDDAKIDRIAKGMKAGVTMPHPVGSIDEHGVVTIQDGHHRVAAAMRLGKKSIRVKVL